MPAPRSVRATNVSANSRAPVPAAMRAAASQRRPPQRRPAEQQGGRLAGAQRPWRRRSTTSASTRVAAARGERGARLGAVAPRHVGRQDQRGHLAGRAVAAATASAVTRHEVGRCARAGRSSRDTLRADGLDVGLQRGVEAGVVGGVVADDVDDGRGRPPGVVEVGEPVAEARAEVQQRGGRHARHPGVAVGGAGDDALEQAEDTAHLRHRVERGDEVHLARARVA